MKIVERSENIYGGGLEIRWHGRGGHGVVGGSEILAAAVYGIGMSATSAPSFGAARSGAPIQAFNRIRHESIGDFSAVTAPNMIIIADDTLIGTEPVANGATSDALFLVNTTQSAEVIARGIDKEKRGIGPFRVATVDASGIAHAVLGRHYPNMALLGALAKCLPLIPLDAIIDAMKGQFKGKPGVLIEKNAEAIRRGFEGVSVVFDARGEDLPKASTLPQLPGWRAMLPSAVIVGAGTSLANNTGGWRTEYPVLDLGTCIQCFKCAQFCPDNAITVVINDGTCEVVGIDLDHCKGCGICVSVCPLGVNEDAEQAIIMKPEGDHE